MGRGQTGLSISLREIRYQPGLRGGEGWEQGLSDTVQIVLIIWILVRNKPIATCPINSAHGNPGYTTGFVRTSWFRVCYKNADSFFAPVTPEEIKGFSSFLPIYRTDESLRERHPSLPLVDIFLPFPLTFKPILYIYIYKDHKWIFFLNTLTSQQFPIVQSLCRIWII